MDATRGLCCGIVALTALVGVGSAATGADDEATVRPAYSAGDWYPADLATLAKTVDELLARASPPEVADRPMAIIAPHAGYRYSGPVAAAAYASLRGRGYKRVIVMAISHRLAATYQGVDVPAELTAYNTPLGPVPIDRQVCDRLLTANVFKSHRGIDRGEHSLELQLPFLQKVLGEFELVPLLVGQMSDSDYTAAASVILPLLDDETLLVASSDFTHFGPRFGYQPFDEDVPDRLRQLADDAAGPILLCDYDGFAAHLAKTKDTICGRGPILLLLRLLSMNGGAQAVRAAFDTSGQMTGDWSSSVTYQSFVFTKPAGTLGRQEQETLLKLARTTITAHLNGAEPPALETADLPPTLQADGACFVTLENHGRLRGCIGNMQAVGPLYEAVVRNALSACHDSRFVNDPVTGGELADIDIEISYLTPLKRVENIEDIVIGRHGLWLVLGYNRGVLLPQVAYERGWSREEFLQQTSRKAGLPLNAWKRPEAEIYSFTAEVFGEKEPGAAG